ncbi:hypothetical protein K493DRAFT_332904 [Basidiobolus meristosporus CBS 931.73]|uniref:UDENN FNIP1/2-type domain-containing protein n=1 Tax=Basidiobolus meristosporus CBS 931.73 TaxID=1314790 RepID=A0A1Y1Z9J1_9FUNG|nr:hypothetical protein K493DRAFT_332904 [Basidiobolus meristosporus CBS 931.73]|eukprot:ORY06943.1 hypothetical protein K493DRAFT_332904 [Basidiobolus meristosporus CBS 931.73]
MLQKLFRKHSLEQSQEKHVNALLEPMSWTPAPFEPRQIRVLVCQDNGDKRKIPLLDTNLTFDEAGGQFLSSSSPSTRNGSSSSWSDGSFFSPRSKRNSTNTLPFSTGNSSTMSSYKKLSYNLDIIGEMMFGAVPLSYKGMTTKIHHIKGAKPQILLTKLFSINMGDLEQCSGKARRSMSINSECSDISSESWSTSANDYWSPNLINRSSNGVDFGKTNGNHSRHDSFSSSIFSVDGNNSDEENTSRAYPTGIPNPKNHRASSVHSLSSSVSSYKDKRLWRSGQTSIENGVFNPTPLPGKPCVGESSALKHSSRSIMYSIGIVISLEDNKSLKDYLFSHFSLLEARLHKLHGVVMNLLCPLLRKNLMKAHCPQSSMYPHRSGSLASLPPYSLQTEAVLVEAVHKFVQDVCDLYRTPRLQTPLWLNLHTFPSNQKVYYQTFISELTDILAKFETPKFNCFISTLFTAVLTNHLSWVPTVTPPGLSGASNSEMKHPFDTTGLSYNPLWAQYSDLYGNTGNPPKLCRVIVVGTNATFVKRILYILSYLLRCNEVFENVEEYVVDDYDSQSDSSSIPRENLDSPLYGDTQPFSTILNLSGSTEHSNRKYPAPFVATLKNSELEVCNRVNYLKESHPTQNNMFQETLTSSPKVLETSPEFDGKFEKNVGLPLAKHASKVSHVTEQLNNSTNGRKESNKGEKVIDSPLQWGNIERRSTGGSNVHHGPDGGAPLSIPATDDLPSRPDGFVEIPMIGSQVVAQIPDAEEQGDLRPDRLFAKSFGRSMMVGYCPKYMPDFVLMGLPRFDFLDELENDLKDSVQYHVDGPVSQSSCIIADTNTWQCNIVDYIARSSDPGFEENFNPKKGVTIQRVVASDFIRQTLTQMQSLFRLGIPAESCARYFEDMLQELFLKSRIIAEVLDSQEIDREIDQKALGAIVSLKESDMPLLLSVAKTHSLGLIRDLNKQM